MINLDDVDNFNKSLKIQRRRFFVGRTRMLIRCVLSDFSKKELTYQTQTRVVETIGRHFKCIFQCPTLVFNYVCTASLCFIISQLLYLDRQLFFLIQTKQVFLAGVNCDLSSARSSSASVLPLLNLRTSGKCTLKN